MNTTEATTAVSELFARFPTCKLPSSNALREWLEMAAEFTTDVWNDAARRHFRENRFGSPNPAEMYALCRRIQGDLREAERAARVRVGLIEQEARWRVEAEHTNAQLREWLESRSDAEIEFERDRFLARDKRGFFAPLFTVPMPGFADRHKRLRGRLMTGAEIRDHLRVAAMLWVEWQKSDSGSEPIATRGRAGLRECVAGVGERP